MELNRWFKRPWRPVPTLILLNRPCGIILLLTCGLISGGQAQQINAGHTEQWHGFEKVNFRIAGTPAYYVKPDKALPGNPWVWRAHFPDWHITMDSLLLKKGFYVAYINTNDQYGAPQAMLLWDRFYQYLTEKLGFAREVALEGVSRGGLYAYGWAKRNPDKVSCIYAEAPVCDFRSWPGGRGKSKGDSANWRQLQEVYGLSEQQALHYQDGPMDHLEGLAAFKVPILHVISLQDHLVPPDENTFPLVQRYTGLGGPATVYPMTRGKQELNGHHFEIEHPERWADFIYHNSYPVRHPLPYRNYVKTRGGLPGFYHQVKSGQPVTVAFLGGSITHNPGWRNKVGQYLQERFPRTDFHFIAAGIPSLGSLPHAFRFQRDVLDSGRVDLLFVEAAVNDRVNGTDSITQVRALDGIVRQAKKSNPVMDIILMSFADPDKRRDYSQHKIPVEVTNHEMVAGHYGLPSINLAKEVDDKIRAGEFSWEYDFKDIHPSPFGQEIYFETIKTLLSDCLAKAKASPGGSNKSPLPASLDPHSFNNGAYLSIGKARLKSGWHFIQDWQPADQVPTRPGFVHLPILEATIPGASLELRFKGTAIGMALVSGPDAGMIAYSIDGKPFQIMDLFTEWSNQLHLPWYVLFGGNLKDKAHTLRLKIAPDKNPNSNGTACRIVYFLVNS